MPTTDELIKQDLISIYQASFGTKWTQFINKPILPSRFRFLSVVYKVSIDYVYSIYNQLVAQIKNGSAISVSC